MALHLRPIFNRNLLYQTLEGTHEILCTSKNPSTIGISNVLDSGNPSLYWTTIIPAKRQREPWYCWSLTSVQHHIDHVALGNASLAWCQIYEEPFSLFPSAFPYANCQWHKRFAIWAKYTGYVLHHPVTGFI